MLEAELFGMFEQTADAVYMVTEQGEICSWNSSAERLFGYPASEVLGRHIEEVLDAYDTLGTEPLVGGDETAVRADTRPGWIQNFDLDVGTRSGERLWINVSTIVFDNSRTGRRLMVRLARDITERRNATVLLNRMVDVAQKVVALTEEASHRTPTGTLTRHELEMLRLFADGGNSTAIARKLGISAQTLRNHLHHINRKLNTHSRLEAVTQAQRRGLIR